MDMLYRCCAGADVHKRTVEVCVRRAEDGSRLRVTTRQFGTMTRHLLALADWLASEGVTHVAMESTGVYWKPIYNILEERGIEVILVNARHVKKVPGRKTDVSDCQWLAQLLQMGLLRGSFIPERSLRELRDLTRHRAQLVGEHTRVTNRIHKTLQDANIKLASVATDILGVSGRAMIKAMIEGNEDASEMAGLARGKLRAKTGQLQEALVGRLTEHHRFMLRMLMNHLHSLEDQIGRFDSRIDQCIKPYQDAVDHIDPVPGIDERVAQNIIAEIGADMSRFPTAAHLSSWSGICSGNDESAGKRRSGRTTKGNRWLRAALVQAAWAASHSKTSYLAAQYRRLAPRRGKKRALIAVGHSMLVIIYQLLSKRCDYEDLGPNHFDRIDPARVARHCVKRLHDLGYRVTLEPIDNAA